MHRFVGILGMLSMMGLAYLFSTDRRAIRYKTVFWGLGLQIAFAFLVMRWRYGQHIFAEARRGCKLAARFRVLRIDICLRRLGQERFADGFLLRFPGAAHDYFHRRAFCAALLLRHHADHREGCGARNDGLMGASGAESLNVAASIFMGQTEAPLSIRPFLPDVTQSELMTIMTSGMAHVSGGMMAAYILYGIKAEHLLAAVIMTAPGTILIAKMLVPETGTATDSRARARCPRRNAT